MNEYPKDQLDDPRWLDKRNEILTRDKNTCKSCGRRDKRMHVHHIKYLPGKKIWEYPNWMLVTYCSTCHETEHMIGDVVAENLIELLRTKSNNILIKPLSQLTVLIEEYPPFHYLFKNFLNEMMMEWLRYKEEAEQNIKQDA